jgi:hypothetical protein
VAAAQLLRAAQAAQAAADHDAYARAERRHLLHAVRREHDGALPALRGHARDYLPHEALCDGVHARARLVEEDDGRVADERDGHGQLALVAARQPPGQLAREGPQVELVQLGVHDARELRGGHALDARVQLQVLARGQEVQESVELRA